MAEVMTVISIYIPLSRGIVECRLQILLRVKPINSSDIQHHLKAGISSFLQYDIQNTARTGRIVLGRCIRHDFDLLDIGRRGRFKQIYDFCLLHIGRFAIQQNQNATSAIQTDGLAFFLNGNSRQLLQDIEGIGTLRIDAVLYIEYQFTGFLLENRLCLLSDYYNFFQHLRFFFQDNYGEFMFFFCIEYRREIRLISQTSHR